MDTQKSLKGHFQKLSPERLGYQTTFSDTHHAKPEHNLALGRSPLPIFGSFTTTSENFETISRMVSEEHLHSEEHSEDHSPGPTEQKHLIGIVILICLYACSYHKINSENNYISMSCALTAVY